MAEMSDMHAFHDSSHTPVKKSPKMNGGLENKTGRTTQHCRRNILWSSKLQHADSWASRAHWWEKEAQTQQEQARLARQTAFLFKEGSHSAAVSMYHDCNFKFVWVIFFNLTNTHFKISFPWL
jgi:hypothetical protein